MDVRPAAARLETERLILRQFEERDFAPYAELAADPEVMRFLSGPSTPADAWRHMAFILGHWSLRGYGLYAVEERATGRFLGRVGFLNPAGWPHFEVAWTLSRGAWGRGFATEAARACVGHAFGAMGLERVVSLIAPENTPSARVAERVGERPDGEAEVHGKPVVVWSLDRATWAGA